MFVVLEIAFAAVVSVLLPVRAWRRHRRGAPPAPAMRYSAETLVLIVILSMLFWRRGIPLQAIGVAATSPLRWTGDLLLCLALIVGVDAYIVWRITRQLRFTGVLAPPSGVTADPLDSKQMGVSFGLVTIVGAIWEELAFRAAAFAILPQTVPGTLASVILGSLLFGAQHLRNGLAGMLYATCFGVAFAALFLITGNLIAVIIAHAAGNLLTGWQWAPRIENARRRVVAQAPGFLG